MIKTVVNVSTGEVSRVELTPQEIAEIQSHGEDAKQNILKQISALEAQQTPRRIREAATWNRDSINFLKEIDRQISTLRNQLKGD